MDFQQRYLEQWLKFIGFTDIRPILVEPTLNPAKSEQAKANAQQAAILNASHF